MLIQGRVLSDQLAAEEDGEVQRYGRSCGLGSGLYMNAMYCLHLLCVSSMTVTCPVVHAAMSFQIYPNAVDALNAGIKCIQCPNQPVPCPFQMPLCFNFFCGFDVPFLFNSLATLTSNRFLSHLLQLSLSI